MELFGSFIIYLVLYRLAVIGAGILSIYWGYRLFIDLASVNPEAKTSKAEKGTDADFSLGKDVQIKLKNAAPGTVFALFGAGIIIAQIMGGGPSLALEQLKSAAGKTETTQLDTHNPPALPRVDSLGTELPSADTKSEATKPNRKARTTPADEKYSLQMRGDEQEKIIQTLVKNNSTMDKEWNSAKQLLAQRFNKDAWKEYKAKDYSHALFNVELALSFAPSYYNALDTKADILHATGKTAEARKVLELAIKSAPKDVKVGLETKLKTW